MREYTHVAGALLLYVSLAFLNKFKHNNNWFFLCWMDLPISRYHGQVTW